jgi:hypothetical protein
MLYACALRMFQGRSLTATSVTFNKNRKSDVAWVDVPAKVTSQNRIIESKVVHPLFIDKVKEIIERRKHNTLLFPLWGVAGSGSSDATRLRLENLMKDLNQVAANTFKWPGSNSYHGTHNFRHGAAQDAYAEGGTHVVMLRTGHLSQACAQHYARSDLERTRKSVFANLRPDAKLSDIRKFLDEVHEKIKKARETADISPILQAAKENKFSPLQNLTAHNDNELRAIIESRKVNEETVREQKCRRQRSPPRKPGAGVTYQPPPIEFARWDIDDTKIVVLQDNFGNRIPARLPNAFRAVPGDLVSDTAARLDSWFEKQRVGPTAPLTALLDIRNYQRKQFPF